MELINGQYLRMLKIFRALGILKLINIPKIKGAVYTFFSKKANSLYSKGAIVKVSNVIDETESIISLTTYGVRTNKVHITLDTIFSQTVRPYKVILWLSEEEFNLDTIPNELKVRLSQYSFFEIGFCEDLKPHKKYYETMVRYPNHNVITIDDDVFYPTNWLITLLDLHGQYPKAIICNNAHKMIVNNGRIGSYASWEFLTDEKGPSLFLCPIGVGGVLYPVGSLHKDLFNKYRIKETCLYADDLWLRIMGLLNRTKVVNSNKYGYTFLSVQGAKETALSNNNVKGGCNDKQLFNIMQYYQNNIKSILNNSNER